MSYTLRKGELAKDFVFCFNQRVHNICVSAEKLLYMLTDTSGRMYFAALTLVTDSEID